MAVVSPGFAVKLMCSSASLSAPGQRKPHIVQLDLTLPVFVLLRGLCSSFVRVVDGGPGADHLVDALRSHTGAGQHDGRPWPASGRT